MRKQLKEFSFRDLPRKSYNILYVGCNDSVRKGLQKGLKGSAINLVVAEDGFTGIEQFNECKPKIIVADAHLSGIDSASLISYIRETDKKIPIVINVACKDLYDDRCGAFTSELIKTIDELSEFILYKDYIDINYDTVLKIMDANSNYIAVYSRTGLKYINKSFRKFLRVKSVKEFNTKHNGLSIIHNGVQSTPGYSDFKKWARIHQRSSGGNNTIVHMCPEDDDRCHTFMMNAMAVPGIEETVIVTFTDVSGLEKEKQLYQFMAEYDPVTKVYARSKVVFELNKEIERAVRYKIPMSLIMIDLDHFKAVNDTYGHHIGDIVLQEAASLIQNNVRAIDVFGRYGGEEFILVMPSAGLNDCAKFADRLRQRLENHVFPWDIKVTCSIGVAEHLPGEEAGELIVRADKALYIAKNSGRNRVEKLNQS